MRRRLQSVTQVALSHFITNGLAVGFGQLAITLVAFHFAGLAAVAAVTAGVVITTVPDTATPQRGKLLRRLRLAAIRRPAALRDRARAPGPTA